MEKKPKLLKKKVVSPSFPNLLPFKVPKKKFSSSGSKKKAVYKYVYDEKYGCPRRVISGYIDICDMVQESADDVDFKTIGKMLVETKTNIIDHFTDKNGQVYDITGQPRNIHEAAALYNKMQDDFAKMPNELKAVFNSDFKEFEKCYRNGSLGQRLESYFKPKVEPAPVEEVK